MTLLQRYAAIKAEAILKGLPITRSFTTIARKEKVWVLDPACSCLTTKDRICLKNRDRGILSTKVFPTGHDSPPAHDDCTCTVITRSRNKVRSHTDTTGFDAFTAGMNADTLPGLVPEGVAVDYLLAEDIAVALIDSTLTPARNLVLRLPRLKTGFVSNVTIDMTDIFVIRDVNGTVGFQMTRGQADGFLDLAENRQSRAKELGIGQMRNRDIGRMITESMKGLI